MTPTERKLDESRYFLSKLDIDDPYFDYNLSAFLNAARSISWVMRNEYSKIEGWEDWFKQYKLSDKSKELLIDINDLRIESTKRDGVKTDFFFVQSDFLVEDKYYSELDKISKLPRGEYLITLIPADEKSIKKSEDTLIEFVGSINRNEKPYDGLRERLKKKCDQYFELMETIVKDCTERFIR